MNRSFILNVIEDEVLRGLVFSTLQTRGFQTNLEPFTPRGSLKLMRKIEGEIDLMVIEADIDDSENLVKVMRGEKVKGYSRVRNYEEVPAIILTEKVSSGNGYHKTGYFKAEDLGTRKGKEEFMEMVREYLE